jgi:hypothetical protein
MVLSAREKPSIEQIEKETNLLLKKNNELMEKWRGLYRQKRDGALTERREPAKAKGCSESRS